MWQSFRAIEAARRTRSETEKHLGQNISPAGTAVPGGLMTPRERDLKPKSQITHLKVISNQNQNHK